MNISRKQRRGCNSTRSNRTNRSNRTKRTNNKKQLGGGESIIIKWGKKVFENVPVNLSISVDELKIQLSKLSGVPADKMKLLKSGTILKDDESLEGSGIQNGSVVHMMGTKIDSKQHPNGTSVNLPISKKSKKSFRSFRSNRSMKPKFKSSMSAPARAHSAPTGVQKSADYFDDYTIFTYDNSPESRAMIGLDHPMLADVTVNDYMHASCRINEDLVNNSLKPIEEKLALIKLSQKFFADVYDALPRGMGDDSHVKTTPSKSKGNHQSLEAKFTSMVPKYIEQPLIAAIGGARVSNRFSGLTVEEPPVGLRLGEQEDAAIPFSAVSEKHANLKQLLTYDKLKHFITLSENNTNRRLGWARRASLFIKYMFLPEDVFRVNVLDKTLTGSMTSKSIENYNFKISSSSHQRHPSSTSEIEVTAGPADRIKLEGAARNDLKMVLNAELVMPLLNCDLHGKNTIELMDIGKFQGRYNQLSPIQKKHIIYSIILFILKNLTRHELTETIDTWTQKGGSRDAWSELVAEQYEDERVHLIETEFQRISEKYSKVIPNDALPLSAFFATFSKDSSIFKSYIQMTRPYDPEVLKKRYVATPGLEATGGPMFKAMKNADAILTNKELREIPRGYKSYLNLIEYFYNKIMLGFGEDVMSYNISVGDVTKPKVVIKSYRTTPEDLCMFVEGKNQDIVSFRPSPGKENTTGEGVIIGKQGAVVPESAFFYTENSDDITIPYMDIATGDLKQYVLKNEAGGANDTIKHWIWKTKSRIVNKRDNLMGHLSNLVYQPNDVIHAFSKVYMEKLGNGKMLVYVGAFDHDPSYPYAFFKNPDGLESGPMPCFSRVHVWLKTFPNQKDHELYVVIRGSKTGYDWSSCDTDIILGVIQNERSTHLPDILRDIIYYLNSCLISNTSSLDVNQRNIAQALNNGGATGKAIQIFASGHSLGGFLAMSISHTAIANDILTGFSFEKISGVYRTTQKTKKLYLKPYIIPIVFDPYLGMSSPIHNAFSFLPYVRIHSCIDTVFNLDPVKDSNDDLRSHDYNMVTLSAVDPKRYDDVASRNFLSFIRQKYSIRKYHDTMGQFFTFHYSNIYNYFQVPELYFMKAGITDRLKGDMRICHDLRHMIGMSSEYIIHHTPTNFYVKTGYDAPFDKQNLRTARYGFPIPKNRAVIPYLLPYDHRVNVRDVFNLDRVELVFELFSVKAIRDNPEDYDVRRVRPPNPVINLTHADILRNTDYKNHYYEMYPFLEPKHGSRIGVNSDFSKISIVNRQIFMKILKRDKDRLERVVVSKSSDYYKEALEWLYTQRMRAAEVREHLFNNVIEGGGFMVFDPQARTDCLADMHRDLKNEMEEIVSSDEDYYLVNRMLDDDLD